MVMMHAIPMMAVLADPGVVSVSQSVTKEKEFSVQTELFMMDSFSCIP